MSSLAFSLADAAALLRRTPRTLEAMLGDLPEPWAHGDEGPDTFSPFEVVGHLIHGERTDWMPRLRLILERGPDVTFEPFDRFAHRVASRGRTLGELLATFAALREENVAALEALGLGAEDLERTGRHPELGRVSARQLLATWVVHDQAHLAQVARVLAKQYDGEVGPWREYLSILER